MAENIIHILNLRMDGNGNYWIPIAFIHILVKNAIKHGDEQQSINVEFIQNEKNTQGIDLVVTNFFDDKVVKKEQGITQKALSYCLNNGKTLCEFDD